MVQAVSLDSLAALGSVSIDVLKIDVDGFDGGITCRRSLKLFIAVAEMLATTKRNFRASLPAWFPLGEAISERLRQALPVGRRLHSFGRSAA
jgi:hypothetical protein